jgi:hypothetical protein
MVVGQMRQRLAFAHQGALAEQGLDQIHPFFNILYLQ